MAFREIKLKKRILQTIFLTVYEYYFPQSFECILLRFSFIQICKKNNNPSSKNTYIKYTSKIHQTCKTIKYQTHTIALFVRCIFLKLVCFTL